MKNLFAILVCANFFLQLIICNLSTDGYIEAISAYYLFRHISIVTHFTCYSKGQQSAVAVKLSKHNIQSRFFTNFRNISRILDTVRSTGQGFAIDLKCPNYAHIFQQENHKVLFRNSNYWMLIDDNPANENESLTYAYISDVYRDYLETLDIFPLSEVVFAKRTRTNELGWALIDLYRIGPGYSLQFKVFGKLDGNQYLDQEAKRERRLKFSGDAAMLSTGARRRNLKGLVINCGLVTRKCIPQISFPERFKSLDDPNADHIDIWTKATLPIGNDLRHDLNMSCVMVQSDSFGWPSNNTPYHTEFNGVMSLFERKKIQSLAHATLMVKERLKFIEWTGEFFTLQTPTIFRQPPLSAVSNIYLLPLSQGVWICCFIMLIMIFVITNVEMRLSIMRRRATIMDVATFVWGAACQQSTYLMVTHLSARFIVLTTFLAAVALFTSYSASIVALLQSPSKSIKTVDDLIRSPLMIAIQETGYNRFYYMKAKDPVILKVYERRIKPAGEQGWIYDTDAGIERVRTELLAYQLEIKPAYKAIGRTYRDIEKCSLSEINILTLPTMTMTVERNFPYKELFRIRIRWQREVGLIDKIYRQYIPKKPKCDGGGRNFVSVDLTDIRPAIIYLLYGILLSLIILVSEIVHKHFTQWRLRQTKKRKPEIFALKKYKRRKFTILDQSTKRNSRRNRL